VGYFALEFVVEKKFSAGKGLKADGTISGDDVVIKICPHLQTVGTFFQIAMLVAIKNVAPHSSQTSKVFRAMRALFVFRQVALLQMVLNVLFYSGVVVTKSAFVFSNVFLLVMLLVVDFAFEKGETLFVFAPDCFLRMIPSDVTNVRHSVPHVLLAI